MRKIIPFIIKLSVVLMVLSVIGQQVTATKGDVERALELLKQARAAIGGESTIGSVQNLSINGKSSRQVRLPDQAGKQLTGEFEMSMILPDKLIRIEKLTIGSPDGKDGAADVEDKDAKIKDVRVKIVRDGEDAQGQNAARHHDQTEIVHYMIGLLLTPPPSFAASYNYAGEGNVDGARADIIEAMGANGFAMKLYLDKSSHLPLMMSYKGSLPRIPIEREIKGEGTLVADEGKDVVIVRHRKDGEAGQKAPTIMFERKIDDSELPVDGRKIVYSVAMNDDAEVQVRFSNFRIVGGLLLPYTLTHVINGVVDAVWTVERYEINSPSINDRFQNEVQWRTKEN